MTTTYAIDAATGLLVETKNGERLRFVFRCLEGQADRLLGEVQPLFTQSLRVLHDDRSMTYQITAN